MDDGTQKAVIMYYGPGADDEDYLIPTKYVWVDGIDFDESTSL